MKKRIIKKIEVLIGEACQLTFIVNAIMSTEYKDSFVKKIKKHKFTNTYSIVGKNDKVLCKIRNCSVIEYYLDKAM